MGKKVAVILTGCGYLDGAEIREAVITLLELDKAGAEIEIFAPNRNQRDVVNHLNGQEMQEQRNVLVESARIARGQITDLNNLDPSNFDALVMPGGYGVAKNLSDFAIKGTDAKIDSKLVGVIEGFMKAKKPIGVMCISPAIFVKAIANSNRDVKVTIGDDSDGMIAKMGANHEVKMSEEICIDTENKIISTSAYMREDSIAKIAEGIAKLVNKTLSMA